MIIRLEIGAVPSAPSPGCPLIYSRIILANVPTDNAGYRVLRWTPRRCVGDRGARLLLSYFKKLNENTMIGVDSDGQR